ncbi:hypothetical protein BDF19DRAFT_194905 [Syncephalis fuscata]|nr:hypothetical protein BDF19DRAFT_194905 [Syncephalis fuscata]
MDSSTAVSASANTTSSQSVGSRLAAAAVMIPRVGPLRRTESMQQTGSSGNPSLSDRPPSRTSTPTLTSVTETPSSTITVTSSNGIGNSASSNSLAAIFTGGGSQRRSKPKNDVNKTTSSFLIRSSPQEMTSTSLNPNSAISNLTTTVANNLGNSNHGQNNGNHTNQQHKNKGGPSIHSPITSNQSTRFSSNVPQPVIITNGVELNADGSVNGRVPGVQKDTFLFFNVGKTFYWSGLNRSTCILYKL